MVGTQHADSGASPPDVNALVDGIRELLRAVRTVRQAGGTVQLPDRLVQVCQEVLEVAASADSPGVPSRTTQNPADGDSQGSVVDKALRDTPLRRLLLQVIAPGETFTVTDMVTRLEKLGVVASPTQVSNALGYQVDRRHLIRERKGLYTYPVKAPSADANGATEPSDASAGTDKRSTQNDRRQSGDDHGRRTVAVRGQEDGRGSNPAQERRKAV